MGESNFTTYETLAHLRSVPYSRRRLGNRKRAAVSVA
jgi:hypothetical protein